MNNLITLLKGNDTISNEIGLLYQVVKIPRMNLDPLMIGYGVWPCNTEPLLGINYAVTSSGCSASWEESMLGTIGETLERYAPLFYNIKEGKRTIFRNIDKFAIHPKEFALFHDKQFENDSFSLKKFDEDTELVWFPMSDLTNGKETWVPGQFIYMPFNGDKNHVTVNTSTGLAAHTNYYKAILTGLFEVIERDSFVITWMQKLVPGKIKISKEIQSYISKHFPCKYEWHFFDISYDIKVPTVFGICFGEAEYGKFVAVSSATRANYGQALKKTIQEIGQAVPYFRYLLGKKKGWKPSDNFSLIQDFEDHSIFYTLRPDLWHVFDRWRNAKETMSIDFSEKNKRNDIEEIRHIVKLLKDKNYNVLFKDITTPDIRQLGFYSVKVFVPQLIPLAGGYPFYFSGGERLYSVPKQMGFESNDFENINKYPHPFP
tara:strand:- start:6296 stop:7588 length:1293 start_codon:yes stop_codon:yes gene_type:complete